MSKTHFLGLNVSRHPMLAGLVWAALFVPAILIVEWLLGAAIPLHKLPMLIALAVVGGLIWGAVMSIFAAGARNDDAR